MQFIHPPPPTLRCQRRLCPVFDDCIEWTCIRCSTYYSECLIDRFPVYVRCSVLDIVSQKAYAMCPVLGGRLPVRTCLELYYPDWRIKSIRSYLVLRITSTMLCADGSNRDISGSCVLRNYCCYRCCHCITKHLNWKINMYSCMAQLDTCIEHTVVELHSFNPKYVQ